MPSTMNVPSNICSTIIESLLSFRHPLAWVAA
jgi:hypothetical protein